MEDSTNVIWGEGTRKMKRSVLTQFGYQLLPGRTGNWQPGTSQFTLVRCKKWRTTLTHSLDDEIIFTRLIGAIFIASLPEI